MAKEIFILKRIENLGIAYGKFCFNTNDQVLLLEIVIKNGAAKKNSSCWYGRCRKYKMDDEVTPDVFLKRQKKPAALLQSPWVNQYDSAVGTSTVGTTKPVLKGASAFKVGLFSPCRSDVEAFESWYKQGLVTKKNGDCGIYVIKYAEYFINEMLKEMLKISNIAQVRKHLDT
ncbi:Ulp1 protease family [Abeliophyllum distichum]|uniref:Ulp1 protease family n=1 Tax=Abeliophyllum distichum TaxID=126358 RepID=A0ABD1P343_9LAMI